MKESGLWIGGWVALLPHFFIALATLDSNFGNGGFLIFTFPLWVLAHCMSRPQNGEISSMKIDLKKAEIRNRLAEIEQELAKQGS